MKVRCCRWACSSALRPRSSTATAARYHGRGAVLCRRGSGKLAGQAARERRNEPQPRLRRDRQTRGRKDARQDQHQRIAAGLKRRKHRWIGPIFSTAFTAASAARHSGSRWACSRSRKSWSSHRRRVSGRPARRHRRPGVHLSRVRHSFKARARSQPAGVAVGNFLRRRCRARPLHRARARRHRRSAQPASL